jgi:hypothetical protein
MDPHLPCADINLWGNGLADSSGSFSIDSWPPSGSQEQVYPDGGTAIWHYNTTAGGTQNLITSDSDAADGDAAPSDAADVSDTDIDVNDLIQNAVANGDAPVNKQGFHFKLQFSQDPQKHKTFWVNCTPTSPPVTAPVAAALSAKTAKAAAAQATETAQVKAATTPSTPAAPPAPKPAGQVKAASTGLASTGMPLVALLAGLLLTAAGALLHRRLEPAS